MGSVISRLSAKHGGRALVRIAYQRMMKMKRRRSPEGLNYLSFLMPLYHDLLLLGLPA